MHMIYPCLCKACICRMRPFYRKQCVFLGDSHLSIGNPSQVKPRTPASPFQSTRTPLRFLLGFLACLLSRCNGSGLGTILYNLNSLLTFRLISMYANTTQVVAICISHCKQHLASDNLNEVNVPIPLHRYRLPFV